MKQNVRVRVFSIKRLVLSIFLGFLFLVSYVFGLLLIDLAGIIPPNAVLNVISWPRWIWMLLGKPFTDDNMAFGLTFMAILDTALYAAMIYPVLLALALARRKPAIPGSPPTPEDF